MATERRTERYSEEEGEMGIKESIASSSRGAAEQAEGVTVRNRARKQTD